MRTFKFKFDLYTLLILIALFFSHDTLLFGINSSEICITIRKVVPFILLFVLSVNFIRKPELGKKDLLAIISLIVLLLASCVINDEEIANYIYRLIIILDAFLLVLLNINVMEKYTSIMYFLSCYSLPFFVCINLFKNILSYMPMVTTYIGHIYVHAIFFVAPLQGTSLYSFTRNHGIFREPGVFMLLLVIAVLYEFTKCKLDTRKIIVFIATILSTGSTAGLIILTAIFMVFCIKTKGVRYKKLVLSMIAFIGVLALLHFGETAFSGKFTYGSNSYGSFYARFSSIITNIEIAASNPFFGCGRYNLYNTVLNNDFYYQAIDNTNSILICYAAFGIPFGLICTYGIFRFISIREQNFSIALFKFIIITTALSNEDIGQNIVFYIMIFLGIHYSTISNNQKALIEV